MSTLYGALYPHAARVAGTLAQRMDRALAHRPAEIVRNATFGPCVLGVRALAHTASVSPFIGAEGCVCAFTGRLDQRTQLAAALSVPAHQTLPDEALVVLAYRRWGMRFGERLLGDFALALFDPHARRLLLVRDALGIRALYYAWHEGTLLFASQAKALLAVGVDSTPSALRMAQYLVRDFADSESTFVRDVRRLPPGHVLCVEQGVATLVRYFQLDPTRRAAAQSSSQLAGQFRTLFCDAVRERSDEGSALGCLLSGGLDSSGVLGALRTFAPARDVPCFSARFPDFPAIDEGAWLALLRARGGVLLHELRADQAGPLDDIDTLHALTDEPFHAPNLFIYHQLSQLARARGVSILLDGLDGDTVVEHGFAFLHELLRKARVRRVVRELRALKRRMGTDYRSLLSTWLFAPERDRARALVARLGFVHTGYASRDFAHESGLDRHLVQVAEQTLRAPLDYHAQHAAALGSPLLAFYLEVHDKVAAAHGIDHRHPFFDRRLVEFCLALPGEQRLHDGWDRVVQRRAFVDLVPDAICARQSKSVWSENFQTQLFARNHERMRALIDSDHSPLRPLCDMARLRRDFAHMQAHAQPDRVLDLWCAVTLGAWLQQRAAPLG